jgi:hypothetical protein
MSLYDDYIQYKFSLFSHSFIVPFPVPLIPNPWRKINVTKERRSSKKARSLFYEDLEVIVHLQLVFPYLFPGS